MRHAQRKKTYSPPRSAQERVEATPEAIGRPVTGAAVTSGPPSNVNTALADEATSSFELRLINLVEIFWSHRNLIAICLGAGLVLGLLIALAMGPSYTATAIIQPVLVSETPAKGAQPPVLDAGTLLESEIQLIELQPLSDPATIALNEKLPKGRGGRSISTILSEGVSGLSGMLRSKGDGKAANPLASRSDIRLDVGVRKRTYLIELNLRASTPERAAAFANAVARQYAYNTELRQIRAHVSGAQQALAELKAAYGDRHPLVVRAESDLKRLQSEPDAAVLAASDMTDSVIAVPATAGGARMTSSYQTLALWGILGLLAALSYVLFKERKRLLD